MKLRIAICNWVVKLLWQAFTIHKDISKYLIFNFKYRTIMSLMDQVPLPNFSSVGTEHRGFATAFFSPVHSSLKSDNPFC
jgi:hypothetical protein